MWNSASPLNVGDQVLDEVHVIFFAAVDLAAQRGRQRMILVQHDGDLAVFFAQHHSNMQTNQRTQTLFGISTRRATLMTRSSVMSMACDMMWKRISSFDWK